MTNQVLQAAAGERADRVEGHVAEQLHPDLVADARRDRAAEPGADQRLGDRLDPVRPGAARLAEADVVAFGVLDDAWLGDGGREVGERPDDAPRLGGRGDDSAGIDPLEAKPAELAAVTLEVPPRDLVLRADDYGVG